MSHITYRKDNKNIKIENAELCGMVKINKVPIFNVGLMNF